MKINRNIEISIVFIAGLVFGIIAGIKMESKANYNKFKETIGAIGVADPIITIHILEEIRNNNLDNAINDLENHLSYQILRLGDGDVSNSATKNTREKSIEKAREYRKKYNFKTGLYSTDRDVSAVLGEISR